MALNKRGIVKKTAGGLIGQPVCVMLTDGSYYVGILSDVDQDGVTLNGTRGTGKLGTARSRTRLSEKDRAQIAGFLGSLFGGGGLGALPGGAGGGLLGGGAASGGKPGFWGMIIPGIKFGVGIVQAIMPLFGMLKI